MGPLFFWEPAPRLEFLFLEVLPTLWGTLLLIALFRYRLRGLWFLLELPLVLWWLAFTIMLGLARI